VIGAHPSLTLAQRLTRVRPFADDSHFGVREWAWLALRSHLAADVDASLELLQPWTSDASPRVRRFAIESMRPRGVWCTHIDVLKKDPALALPLLQSVRADVDSYVQASVGNWLNDAAKSQPIWVAELCQEWTKNGDANTARICRVGTRSV
jgi:3-methyladenine DNA glycosylase AlkC